MTLTELYISAVVKVNECKTDRDHWAASQYVLGIRDAAEAIGMHTGNLIMAADMHYIEQGIDRPMCGGEWLDWKPA